MTTNAMTIYDDKRTQYDIAIANNSDNAQMILSKPPKNPNHKQRLAVFVN